MSSRPQELRRKLARQVAVKIDKVRTQGAVEDRKQQQRVFNRLSARFHLADKPTCALRRRSGFRRSIAFDMDEWSYERDL
jgi:chorismate mutase